MNIAEEILKEQILNNKDIVYYKKKILEDLTTAELYMKSHYGTSTEKRIARKLLKKNRK